MVTSAEYSALHIVHVTAALLLMGCTFFAFGADPSKRKATLMWGGIASLVMLLTGFRMWQSQFGLAVTGWIIVKIVCWLALSALTGIGFRRRGNVGALAVIAILCGLIAVAMAYTKPF